MQLKNFRRATHKPINELNNLKHTILKPKLTTFAVTGSARSKSCSTIYIATVSQVFKIKNAKSQQKLSCRLTVIVGEFVQFFSTFHKRELARKGQLRTRTSTTIHSRIATQTLATSVEIDLKIIKISFKETLIFYAAYQVTPVQKQLN